MNFDRRSEARERVRLPVAFAGGEVGVTRDVSASGLFVEVDGRVQAGDEIALSVALSDDQRPMRLTAQGVAVRVEPRGEGCGVGFRMLTSSLEEVTPASAARQTR